MPKIFVVVYNLILHESQLVIKFMCNSCSGYIDSDRYIWVVIGLVTNDVACRSTEV